MVGRAVFLLETLGDQASPCLFQLLESAFKPAVLEYLDVCFITKSASLTFTFLLPSHKDPCDYTGPM